MKRRIPIVLMTAAWLSGVPTGTASAQTVMPDQRAVFLAPVDGDVINSPSLFAEPNELASPDTPAWGIIKGDLDFLFLQPLFPGRAVRLQVPTPGGVVIGDTSDLSNDFAFSPGFEVGYQFRNTGFGVQVTGRLLHLTGGVDRTLHDSAGAVVAQASARSTVDLGVVNPIEGFVAVPLSEFAHCDHPYLGESSFVFTLGGRYAHVQQHYTTTVVTGPSHQGSLTSTQTFDGFGLTSSVMGVYPVKERWALYSNVRGSILIGDNNRQSSVTIVAPGANSATRASEDATEFVPVGEFEVGLMYGIPLNRPGPSPNLAPLLWVKTGLVAHVWGELGLLNINNAPGHQFEDSPLWLVGFSLQIGLDY